MNNHSYHEKVSPNSDVGVRFYLSEMLDSDFVSFHWHRSLEIIYVIHGQLTFTFNQTVEIISDGQFIVIPSGVIHSVANTPNESYVLQIPIEFINNYWPHAESTGFNLDTTSSNYGRVASFFPILGEIYANKVIGYQFIFQATILQILFCLFTSFGQVGGNQNDKDNKLKEVLGYIDEHYSESLTIKDLAEKFSYNPNYLSRLFKQKISLSPVQYIYQVRESHFYQDLIHTEIPVAELLLKNGLTNKSLAIQRFKDTYGVTPLQARKQKR